MNKTHAQTTFNSAVENVAARWARDFGHEGVNESYTETGFQDIPSEVIKALELENPWREFHDAVEARVAEIVEKADAEAGESTRWA